jgi:hypothetical protein
MKQSIAGLFIGMAMVIALDPWWRSLVVGLLLTLAILIMDSDRT